MNDYFRKKTPVTQGEIIADRYKGSNFEFDHNLAVEIDVAILEAVNANKHRDEPRTENDTSAHAPYTVKKVLL